MRNTGTFQRDVPVRRPPQGERSEPEACVFSYRQRSALSVGNKPCTTPECPEGAFRCEVTRRVSAANLKHVRFGDQATVWLDRKISHAQHRDIPKECYGAKGGDPPAHSPSPSRQSPQRPLAPQHLCRAPVFPLHAKIPPAELFPHEGFLLPFAFTAGSSARSFRRAAAAGQTGSGRDRAGTARRSGRFPPIRVAHTVRVL